MPLMSSVCVSGMGMQGKQAAERDGRQSLLPPLRLRAVHVPRKCARIDWVS